jgi:hypothetical protein
MIGSAILVVFVVRESIKRSFRVSQAVKLCLFWFQVLAMYPLLFQGWPSQLQNMFNFFSLANLEIGYFGIGCDVKKSFYKLTFVKLSGVPVIWVSLVLLEAILSLKGNSRLGSFMQRIDKITAQCLFILNFFSLQVFSIIFQIFNCVPVENGYALKDDPSESCSEKSWHQAVGVVSFFIVLYGLLIPAFLLYRYWIARKKSDDSFMNLCAQICNSYREDCQQFEVERIFFKLFFVIIRDVLSVSGLTKTAFLVLLFSIHIWLESWFRPYKEQETNGLSML